MLSISGSLGYIHRVNGWDGSRMIKYFVCAALSISMSGVYAEEVKDPCLAISNLSASIMKHRQNEGAMADMMAVFNDEKDPELKKTLKGLVIAAYERPAYSTDANKTNAVSRFQNDVYLKCVKDA